MKWATRKKVLPELILRAVMCLYHGAKTKVRVGSELSEEFISSRNNALSELGFKFNSDVSQSKITTYFMSLNSKLTVSVLFQDTINFYWFSPLVTLMTVFSMHSTI